MYLPGRVVTSPTPRCGRATCLAVAPRIGATYPSAMAVFEDQAPAPGKNRKAPWLRLLPFSQAQVAAAVLLTISFWLPFWRLTLTGPAHPEGIRLTPYLDDLQGPLQAALAEAGGLGDPLRGELAQLERSLDVALATVVVLLLAAALFAGKRWAALLAVPAACFPLIAIADTTRVLGHLEAGSLTLAMRPGWGFLVAATASLTALASLWLHFQEYRFEN